MRVKIDLSKDSNTAMGWIRGRIDHIRACDADISNLSDKKKDDIKKIEEKKIEDEARKKGDS